MHRRTTLPRHVWLRRKSWFNRKPNTDPTREFVDKTTGELRLILSGADWRAMKREMWKSGKGRLKCGICGFWIKRYRDLEPDHIKPRGFNGSKRTDLPENIQASHSWCNFEKGSQRI